MSAAVTRPTRRRTFKLVPPVVPEHARQRQISDCLRLELCREGHVSPQGVCWFSIDMAHYAGVPGTRVARGICAGVPDIILLHRSTAHWIEIKTDAGVLSDDQRSMCAALLLSGCRYAVCRDAAEVLAAVDRWAIPRARRTHGLTQAAEGAP